MAINTPNTLLTLALKHAGVLGVGQTALAEDMNDALDLCNAMLSQWQRKRWIIWHLVDVSVVSTGAQSYTVTTGGSFNVARPDRIESAFLRQVNVGTNPVDWPLEILESREDYSQVRLKSLTSFPQYVFYDAAFPTGVLFPWPIPQASIYEVHIQVKEQIGQFASLAATINLPSEHLAAVLYNIAKRLRIAYQLGPDPELNDMAKESLNVLRQANAQIPRLKMPDQLIRKGSYNVYSDQN